MLATAGGDFLILWLLRTVPRRIWVRDHPSQVGALVLGVPSADEAPTLAFDLDVEEGVRQKETTKTRGCSHCTRWCVSAQWIAPARPLGRLFIPGVRGSLVERLSEASARFPREMKPPGGAYSTTIHRSNP